MRAFSNLRHAPHYRADAFAAGLRAIGAHFHGLPRGSFQPGDVLLSWNRYGAFDAQCAAAERAGATVLVIENGVLGRDAPGGPWYSIARRQTALVGGEYEGVPAVMVGRATAEIGEWRHGGREVIVLAQRGIGPPGLAQPRGWEHKAARWFQGFSDLPVRIRAHPGEGKCTPLEDDLAHAALCVTWASGAGVRALAMGIQVAYGLRTWIAAAAGWHFGERELHVTPHMDRIDREPLFKTMGWATWNTEEIARGFPIARLLSPSTGSGTTSAAV